MIKYACDICGKETTNLKSIVLYKKTFDYCPKCEKKANKIIIEFKKVMKQEYIRYESNIRKSEREFYKDIVGGNE